MSEKMHLSVKEEFLSSLISNINDEIHLAA